MQKNKEITVLNAWQSYAIGDNDRASGDIVDQDVRRFMQDTGETDYSIAMMNRRQQVLEAGMTQCVRPTTREKHYAGVELLDVAKEYQKTRPELADKEAFNLALLSKPDLAEQYIGRSVRRDGAGEVTKFFGQEIEERKVTATERLAEIVDAVPTLSDDSRDWPAVGRTVLRYSDIIEQAAHETMDRLIKGLIAEERIWFHPVDYDDVKRKLERRLRAKHPELAQTLDNPNNLNKSALKLILDEQR